MSWFAIRTKPGAQQQKREYWTEDSPKSKKGYRVHYDEYHGGHDYSSLGAPLRAALVLMAGRG